HPASWPAPVRPTQVGIVHLGIGAFHRAHQAVVTEDAARATGDVRWGILGVTQRSAAVRDQLRPQGGVYAVLTVGPDGASPRVVGSVTDVAWPAEETPRVLAALAAPTTHVVSLTVTEKGYARRADGHLDTGSVRADLDALAAEEAAGPPPAAPGPRVAPATSAVGLLVRGLAARRRAPDRAELRRPRGQRSCARPARVRGRGRGAPGRARRRAARVPRRLRDVPVQHGGPHRPRHDSRPAGPGRGAARRARRGPRRRGALPPVGDRGPLRRSAARVGARRGDPDERRRALR